MADYDKLKEMYRLQGQEEQGRRFREMTGAPDSDEDLRARLGLNDAAPRGPAPDGLQDMQRRLEQDRLVDADNQTFNRRAYASDDLKTANSQLAEALGGDRFGVHGMPASDAISLVQELYKRGLITAATPDLKKALGESGRRKAEFVRADSISDRAYGERIGGARVAPYRAGEEPGRE